MALTRTEVLTLERVVAGFDFYFFFEKGYVIVIKVEYIEQVTFFFTKKKTKFSLILLQ